MKILRNQTLAIKLEDSFERGVREGVDIGKAQAESGLEMMMGEILKAAFADPLGVRYAFEKSKAPTPVDPKHLNWRAFLAACAETACLKPDEIRGRLAEMGVEA